MFEKQGRFPRVEYVQYIRDEVLRRDNFPLIRGNEASFPRLPGNFFSKGQCIWALSSGYLIYLGEHFRPYAKFLINLNDFHNAKTLETHSFWRYASRKGFKRLNATTQLYWCWAKIISRWFSGIEWKLLKTKYVIFLTRGRKKNSGTLFILWR